MSDSALPSVDELMEARAEARPDFMPPPSGDRVLNAVMRLAMEVSVLSDRLDVYEQVAGDLAPEFKDRVDSFSATPELENARLERRRKLIRRLLRDLR